MENIISYTSLYFFYWNVYVFEHDKEKATKWKSSGYNFVGHVDRTLWIRKGFSKVLIIYKPSSYPGDLCNIAVY